MIKEIKQKNMKIYEIGVSRSTSNGMKSFSKTIFSLLILISVFSIFSIFLNNNGIKINKNIANAAENCTIVSAEWDPSGEQGNGFYQQFKTTINIIIKTKNCVNNSNLTLTVFEEDGIITENTDDTWNDSGLKDRSITVPSDNFTVNIQAGEEDCGSTLGGELGKDCDLYFKIMNNGSVIYNSADKSKGFLYYDCEVVVAGGCFDDAKLLKIINNGTDSVTIETQKDDKPGTKPEIYTLLAPIGELTTAPDNIGDYFNTMFKIAIGICAVLAVVMIVIGGIQYMGNESIFGKTEAKTQIWHAILGLLIALASFALLNTIDPALLGINGVNVKQVSAEIDNETETAPWEGSSVGDNKILCPEGYYTISVPWGVGSKKTLNVCSSIKEDVTNLLNDAKANGILLSGSGARTLKEQQDIWAEKKCNPPGTVNCSKIVARPGHSMHESGKAIDFRCNNKKMIESDDCFKWLKENASKSKYGLGLKNLPGEAWHWSTTGH